MKVREYSYLCSQKLLGQIASDKYADALGRDIDSLKPLAEAHPIEKDVNIKWQLISTALLMSEGLFKNTKTYDYITPEVYEELENVLGSIGVISECRPLNIHNTPVYDFGSLVDVDVPKEQDEYHFFDCYGNPIEEDDEIKIKSDEVPVEEYEDSEGFDAYEADRAKELQEVIEANSSFIVDGKIYIPGFIKMVRNALAHSSYEIVEDPLFKKECIHLFHYNHDTRKLDMNIILNEDVVIPIIDILNEIVYCKYQVFEEYSSYEDLLLTEHYEIKDGTDEDFIRFILSFAICDEEIARRILMEAKKKPLFNTPVFASKDDEDFDEDYVNENKIKAICATLKDYIKPLCDYGIIINNLAYTQNDLIVSDELYDKYGIYSYLRGDFYESTYALSNDPRFLENELRLKIFSLLNCLLLTINNEVHNNNLDDLILDFSAMDLPKETDALFEAKQVKKNLALADGIKNEIINSVKQEGKLKGIVSKKKHILKDCYKDIDYYNITLPKQIKELEDEIVNLLVNRKTKGKKYLEIIHNLVDYNYNDNYAIYILNALRNSMAHGNVRFDDAYDDIGDMQITFEDYNPDNPNELTFKGTIPLCELISILISKENLAILKMK